MQVVMYAHRTGEGLPAHARVIEVSQATVEAVRPTLHGAVDAMLNDIKAGWTPDQADAKAAKEAADAQVNAALATLAEAKTKQDQANRALGIAPEPEAAPATPAAPADTSKKGPLPDDFPGVTALRDAGITTYAKLRDYGDVTDVPGIGAATEAKIKAALAAP